MQGYDNILNRLGEQDMPVVTKLSSYLWNIFTLIPGIPVLAIMVRYNLLNGTGAGPKTAAFLGAAGPTHSVRVYASPQVVSHREIISNVSILSYAFFCDCRLPRRDR
jgi:hypothetical protein